MSEPIVHPLPEFEADVICENTEILERDLWLETRRTGLGGSDAAATLNLSPYTSQVALYLDKVDPLPDEDKEIFQAGRRTEPVIADWFRDTYNLLVVRAPIMLRSHRHPFMLANVDRFVYDDVADEWAVLEIKNVDRSKASEWKDGPPIHARLQGLHYLEVCGENFKRLYVAALVGGNKFIHYVVERDEELIATLVAAEEKFWTLVQLQRMPDVDGSDSTRSALLARAGEVTREEVQVDQHFVDLLARRAAIKASIAIETERLTKVENEMITLMDGAEVAVFEGDVAATWKITKRKSYTVAELESRRWNVYTKKEQ